MFREVFDFTTKKTSHTTQTNPADRAAAATQSAAALAADTERRIALIAANNANIRTLKKKKDQKNDGNWKSLESQTNVKSPRRHRGLIIFRCEA